MSARLRSVMEVAEQLRIHPETVREMARRGDIPSLKLGGRTSPYRFRQSSIDAYLAGREAKSVRRRSEGRDGPRPD